MLDTAETFTGTAPQGAVLIGRGAFTRAYSHQGKVLLRTCDPCKEAQAFGWFPTGVHWLSMTKLGCDAEDCAFTWYETELVGKFSKAAVSAEDWKTYQALQEVYKKGIREYRLLYEALTQWPELQEALEALANYGSDISFEISPRNLGSRNGRMVFLDVFFLRSHLDKVRSSRIPRL